MRWSRRCEAWFIFDVWCGIGVEVVDITDTICIADLRFD